MTRPPDIRRITGIRAHLRASRRMGGWGYPSNALGHAMTEETLFIEASKIADPAERVAFLERACAGNPDLRGRLDKLLARHAEVGYFLGNPAALPPTAE